MGERDGDIRGFRPFKEESNKRPCGLQPVEPNPGLIGVVGGIQGNPDVVGADQESGT